MKYINNTLDFKIEEDTVITLGKFDGLHRGHELLMENLLDLQERKGLRSVVFTFDIPPKAKVCKEMAKQLTTNAEKLHIFEKTGVDYLIECPFTDEVRAMDPETFIRWIVESLHVRYIVVGKDFRFGYQRAGDYQILKQNEQTYGYQTIVLEKIQEDGRDISSTYIREELAAGNLEKANHLLGYDFFIRNPVIHGKQIGRTIGIPTINMRVAPEKIIPPHGVYVTRVVIGENWYMGVTNVGCKPTIEGDNPVGVETYIMDFCQNLYDREVQIDFLSYIRPEKKFSSLDELKAQMRKDIRMSRNYYNNITKMC